MIRKRRRKTKLALERKKRAQLGIIVGGAMIAAILTAGLPRSCAPPQPPNDAQLREQMQDLADQASARDPSAP